MADIKLRIEVNPNAETETLGDITNKVNDVGSNANLSNASFKANSNGVYINTSNPKESGREMLSWGENGILKFDSAGNLSSNGVDTGYLASETEPDEFVWGVVPSTKKYSVKLTFSNATSLKDIVIYGDSTAKQFPTKAIIDGSRTIYSDDPKWAINMETESDTHTIEFTEWNRANYNACLTKIRVMLQYYEIDKFNGLQSVESLSQSTSDPKSIAYGVLASSGNANIVDISGEIADMIQEGILPNSNVPAELYVNGNKIQEHIITDSDYNENDKTFSSQFSDKFINSQNQRFSLILPSVAYEETGGKGTYLGLLQSLIYHTYPMGETKAESDKALNELLSKKYIKIRTLDNTLHYTNLFSYLLNIQYPALKFYEPDENAYKLLDSFCQAAQLNLIFNDDGGIDFEYGLPSFRRNKKDKHIVLPRYLQMSQPKTDVIIKNGVDKISFNNKHRENSYTRFDFKYSLKHDGVFTLDEFDNPIYSDSQAKKLTFFVTINSSELFVVNTLSYSDNAVYPASYRISSSSLGQGIDYTDIYLDQISTKQDYTPSSIPFEELTQYRSQQGTVIAVNIVLNDDTNISDYDNIEVSILLRNCTENASSKIYGTGDRLLEYPYDNIYLFDDVLYNNSDKFQELSMHNIITYYKNGVRSANVTVSCSDLYFNDGTLAKNWANGEILQVGDFVRIDKDNNGTSLYKYQDGSDIIWRITGRKFKYDGVPLIDLELQELIDI